MIVAQGLELALHGPHHAAAVAAAQGIQATINLTVIEGPAGSSLISTVQAFRFFGSAAAPVLFLPIYMGVGGAAFWVSSAALVLAAAHSSWVEKRAGSGQYLLSRKPESPKPQMDERNEWRWLKPR